MSVCRGRILRLVMALVLCLQSCLAMAHCLRLAPASGAAPLHMEICTVDGLVTLDLADDGGQPEGEPRLKAGFCFACHALPGILLPEPPMLAEPVPRPAVIAFAGPGALMLPGARAPPYASRAPPAFS